MTDKAKAMVLASFVADALCLGVHWIYNTRVIDKKWGRVQNYIKPERPTYHPTKDLGEFTHYGDQTLVLLRSVAECNGFDLNRFAERWRDFFQSYDGYFDTATKETLENFAGGKSPAEAGSESDDLAGAARIAPLGCFYRHDPDAFIAAARSQTALTHNNRLVTDSADFFARVTSRVLDGEKPTAAVTQVRREAFERQPFGDWIDRGFESAEEQTRQAMLDFGQMCEVEAAFPGVIHLIARYEDDLQLGLIENAMAGGDSAGRGLLVGMVLGAHLGVEAIPERWLAELKHRQEIANLLDKM